MRNADHYDDDGEIQQGQRLWKSCTIFRFLVAGYIKSDFYFFNSPLRSNLLTFFVLSIFCSQRSYIDTKGWDVFRTLPPEAATRSEATNSKLYFFSIKLLKVRIKPGLFMAMIMIF